MVPMDHHSRYKEARSKPMHETLQTDHMAVQNFGIKPSPQHPCKENLSRLGICIFLKVIETLLNASPKPSWSNDWVWFALSIETCFKWRVGVTSTSLISEIDKHAIPPMHIAYPTPHPAPALTFRKNSPDDVQDLPRNEDKARSKKEPRSSYIFFFFSFFPSLDYYYFFFPSI